MIYPRKPGQIATRLSPLEGPDPNRLWGTRVLSSKPVSASVVAVHAYARDFGRQSGQSLAPRDNKGDHLAHPQGTERAVAYELGPAFVFRAIEVNPVWSSARR